MAFLTVRPSQLDKNVARAVASHTDQRVEKAAGILTWGADEHVLLGLAALGWLASRGAAQPCRRFGDHVLLCSLVTATLPHIMKSAIDQERPDRLTIQGHLRGVPFSGKAEDAFPSGHALHIGALASASTLLPHRVRNAVLCVGAVLVTTRIVLLAHWVTDVIAGVALGALTERGLRRLTHVGSVAWPASEGPK